MKPNTPPRLAVRLMKRLFPDEERYTTLGDLEEVFHYIYSTEGAGSARVWYWRQLLSALGPYLSDAIIKNGELMFRNYLRVAARGLRRRPGYTFINVMGLAVGLACCLLIFLFVRHERAFDRFHENGDRIYRMATRLDSPTDDEMNSGRSPLPHAPLVAEALPEIEAYARFFSVPESFVLARGEDRYSEPGLLFADAAALEIFSFPLKRGDPATALDAPFTAVLTEAAAVKYFGNADPMGQTLIANGEHEFTVAGILEDVPATSHLQFDGLLSIESARQMKMAYFEDRLNLVHATYFLIRPDADPAALQMKMNDVIERAWGEGYRSINLKYTAVLEPLREVYLHSKRRGLGLAGSLENLYIFSVIALFTLAIACINFTNLATARSAERAREVGVRKALGAQRGQLAWQFLGESVLLTFLASILAAGLAWAFLPTFNELAERTLSLTMLGQPELIGLLFGLTLLVGLVAGSYPALVLSRFRPASVLKGALSASGGGVWLRKGLVVFQFGISVVLICGTGIVYRQLQHMQQQRLGFRTEQMLVLDTQGDADAARQIDAIKRELRHIPGVAGVTASDAVPGKGAWQALSYVQGAGDETREMLIRVFQVDAGFIGEYDLGIVAGRSFTPDLASDSAVALS
jgi:putative ABC transport system permease protein